MRGVAGGPTHGKVGSVSLRRRRVLVYSERSSTLNEIKQALGRAAELITASDLATIEAALRLYQSIDAVVVEKSSERNTPITVLRLAEQAHPTARRLALVEHSAIKGVFDAVHDRSITHLMFLPVGPDELRETIGIEADAAAANAADKATHATLRRAFAQPAQSGGSTARSSPSLST